jgi:hypothetical protein
LWFISSRCDEEKAEPAARANVTVCHGSCWRTLRASRCRGSSLTLGKEARMRDPNRIPEILKALEELWRMSPDLRLGQLLVTATNKSGRNVVCPEIFYAEDDELLKGIEAYRDLLRQSKNENA